MIFDERRSFDSVSFAVVLEGEFLAVGFLSRSTFGLWAGDSEVADCFHGFTVLS